METMDPRGRRPRLRNIPKPVGIATAGVVAAGTAFGGVALATGGSQAPAAPTAQTAHAASGPTGQAAELNALLASADSSGNGSGNNTDNSTGAWRKHHHRHRLARVRLLGGMYGQFTFGTKHGTKTIAFERGTVTSVTSTTLVIKAKNGTTWTWQLAPSTRVREDRTLAKASAITNGEQVFTGGQVTNGARDAKIVIIRPKGAAQ